MSSESNEGVPARLEKQVSDILERITDGFVALDKNWCYTYMNKKAGELARRNPAEMIGKSIWSEFPEGIGQPYQLAYERAMSTKQYVYLEEYYAPYDMWFEIHVYPSPEGLSIFFRDITEKKNQELKLRESEERYHVLIEQAADGFVMVNEKGKILVVNNALCELLGYTREELLALDIADTYQETERHIVKQRLAKVAETGTLRVERLMLKKDAGLVPVETIISKTTEGNFQAIIRDITERKKAEEKLKQSEEKYRTLFEQMDEGFCIIEMIYDSKGKAIDYRFLEINPAFVNQTGLTDALTRTIREMVPNHDRHWFEIYGKVARTGEPVRFENPATAMGRYYDVFAFRIGGEGSRKVGVFFNDITERKKAGIALKNEKERLEKIVNTVPGAICSFKLNPDGSSYYPYCSPNMLDVSGIKPEELKKDSAPFLKRIHSDDIENIMKAIYASAQNMTKFQVECRFEHPQKGWIWIGTTSLPATDTDGSIAWTGFVSDITEQKKAEEEIRERGELYKDLVDHITDLICTHDLDGRILSMNRAAEKAVGQKFDPLRSFNIKDILTTGTKNKYDGYIAEILKNGHAGGIMKIKNSAGEVRIWEFNNSLKKTGDNTPPVIRGYARDITESKKAEEELLLSKERFYKIFEKTPYSATLTEAGTGRIEEVNEAFEVLFGYTRQETIGKTSKELKLYKNTEDREKMIARFQMQGFLHHEEVKLLTKTKGARDFLVNSDIVDIGGQKYILTIAEDITEKKKTTEEIKNTTEQLRQLTAYLQSVREEERKRISREIHDELGQQLTAVKMDVVWIEKNIAGKTAAVKTKFKNTIHLLDQSNVSIRKILNELRTGVPDHHELPEALQWLGKQFTKNTGIPVSFKSSVADIKVEEPEAACLFRVYQEALTNITRHTKAKKVCTSLKRNKDMISLAIEDDGKGFNTSVLQNTRSFGILGMKERVAALNGKFELTSSAGKGTKISVSIPMNEKQSRT